MMKFVTKVFSLLSMLVMCCAVKAQVTTNSLDQVADNSQGQYQTMNMGYAVGSIGMTQSAWLDPLQNLGEGQTKPAYSKYYWSPDLVLPLRLREGMFTLINFPEWEVLESIYIGDEQNFTGEISGPNTLLLYPKQSVGVDTNVVVFGRSGNKYVFYVKSEGYNTERLTNSIIDIEVVDDKKNSEKTAGSAGGGKLGYSGSATNGGAKSLFTRRNQKEDWIKSIPLDPTKLRFDIEVYVPNPDDVVIAPERVWRDDIFTYIDFGERALSMTQRPIVTLIVERSEIPVSFRADGPNNRLIIVEGIGDMVLRNGKRMICLKLRRSDDAGTEYAPVAESNDWAVPPPIPNLKKNNTEGTVQGFDFIDINKKEPTPVQIPPAQISSALTISGNDAANTAQNEAVAGEIAIKMGKNGELIIPEYVKEKLSTGNLANSAGSGSYNNGFANQDSNSYGSRFANQNSPFNKANNSSFSGGYQLDAGYENSNAASISVELGVDNDVNNLEDLWHDLSTKYNSVLAGYQPFYSVDAPADGQGKELFHLRIGPIESLNTGDEICSQLGRNGVFCSVVRVQ